MKKLLFSSFIYILFVSHSFAQTTNPVLVEVFTETGCGACAENDSAFQALTQANQEKMAVITYHCFYSLDTFYTYNKACDEKYKYYDIHGYPSAMTNGVAPGGTSSHISYVNSNLINKLHDKPAQYKIEVSYSSAGKNVAHGTTINVKATALKDVAGKDIRMYIAVTENNIIYEDRYHVKSVNGISKFDHIYRMFLPNNDGTQLGEQKSGKENSVKVVYKNDDKEIKFNEVQFVVYIQDVDSKEVLGTYVSKEHSFK